jgi:hypothetical protein
MIMATTQLEQTAKVPIYRMLESAVVLSWRDLVKTSRQDLIHVEYGAAPERSLQYLKIWRLAGRGAWDLVCEYWMRPGSPLTPTAGLTFSSGHYSAALAEMLEFIMQHQDSFSATFGTSSVGLLQVQAPTKEATSTACDCMSEAYKRIGLAYAGTSDSVA